MKDIIIVAIVLVVVVLASIYVYKSKKKGNRCIGCPHSCNCSANDKKNCSK